MQSVSKSTHVFLPMYVCIYDGGIAIRNNLKAFVLKVTKNFRDLKKKRVLVGWW